MSEPVYIRYDKEIWSLPDTDVLQRLILNHIWSFNQKGLECFTPISAFADLYQLHPDVIISSIENLTDMGYIRMEKDGWRNILKLDMERKANVQSFWDGEIFDV